MSIVAWETNVGWDFTLPAVTDLSNSNFYFANLASNGNVAVNTVAGGACVGIITNGAVGASGAPEACSIRMGGPCKVVCGGSFNPGDLISSDSSGRAVKYTGATVFTGTPYQVSGSMVLATALSAGALNDFATVLFNPQGVALISQAA